MVGRGKFSDLMPAPLPVGRKERAVTPMPSRNSSPIRTRSSTPMGMRTRSSTPMGLRSSTPLGVRSTRASTPLPTGRGSRASTPLPTVRGTRSLTPLPTGRRSRAATPQPTARGSRAATPQPTARRSRASTPLPTGRGSRTSSPAPKQTRVSRWDQTHNPKLANSASSTVGRRPQDRSATPSLRQARGESPMPRNRRASSYVPQREIKTTPKKQEIQIPNKRLSLPTKNPNSKYTTRSDTCTVPLRGGKLRKSDSSILEGTPAIKKPRTISVQTDQLIRLNPNKLTNGGFFTFHEWSSVVQPSPAREQADRRSSTSSFSSPLKSTVETGTVTPTFIKSPIRINEGDAQTESPNKVEDLINLKKNNLNNLSKKLKLNSTKNETVKSVKGNMKKIMSSDKKRKNNGINTKVATATVTTAEQKFDNLMNGDNTSPTPKGKTTAHILSDACKILAKMRDKDKIKAANLNNNEIDDELNNYDATDSMSPGLLKSKLRDKMFPSPPKNPGEAYNNNNASTLPIINSLSAAAKQTSSFLKNVEAIDDFRNTIVKKDFTFRLNKPTGKTDGSTTVQVPTKVRTSIISPISTASLNGDANYVDEAPVSNDDNIQLSPRPQMYVRKKKSIMNTSTNGDMSPPPPPPPYVGMRSPMRSPSTKTITPVMSPNEEYMNYNKTEEIPQRRLSFDANIQTRGGGNASLEIPPELAALHYAIPHSIDDVINRGPAIPSLPYEEDMAAKESVLGALGLTSSKALSEHMSQVSITKTSNKNASANGAAATSPAPKVPKIRIVYRPNLKKHRRSDPSSASSYKDKTYTVCREGDPSVDWNSPTKPSTSCSWMPRMPIASGYLGGMQGITLFSGSPENHGTEESVMDGATKTNDGGKKGILIPEKSSSFAIHPGRLCEDVCCYCHNKFGLYDTPLHVAQLKGDDKQSAVLAREPFLSVESCLCDACFRHLDRPLVPKGINKNQATKSKVQNQVCCYNFCNHPGVHPLMRKWKRRARGFIKEDKVGKNYICENHYAELARIGSCGLCKKRLQSQQMYRIEPNAVVPMNKALRSDYLPVYFNATMSLCKRCRFYMSLRVRTDDYMNLTANNRNFLREHRTKVLKALNVDPGSVPNVFVEREKPKKPKKKAATVENNKQKSLPSPPVVSAAAAIAATAALNTINKIKPKLRVKLGGDAGLLGAAAINRTNNKITGPNATAKVPVSTNRNVPQMQARQVRILPKEVQNISPSVEVEILPVKNSGDKVSELRRLTQSSIASRLTITPGPSSSRTNTEERPQVSIMPISSRNNRKQSTAAPPPAASTTRPRIVTDKPTSEITLDATFVTTENTSKLQKVHATFQFDNSTRELWNKLQAPYGSHSSFLRHLVLLEKYWRNGDLVSAPTSSARSRQYLNSVQNRIQAYEGTTGNDPPIIPMISEVVSLSADSWNKL